jgi:hypothetical protein
MHTFGVLFFFSLGVMAITMWGDRIYERLRQSKLRWEIWPLVAVLVGVGLAFASGFDMWAQWGVHIRTLWLGEALTGAALGGTAVALRSIVGFFLSLHRKFEDQAEVVERQELRRVA